MKQCQTTLTPLIGILTPSDDTTKSAGYGIKLWKEHFQKLAKCINPKTFEFKDSKVKQELATVTDSEIELTELLVTLKQQGRKPRPNTTRTI